MQVFFHVVPRYLACMSDQWVYSLKYWYPYRVTIIGLNEGEGKLIHNSQNLFASILQTYQEACRRWIQCLSLPL